MKLICPNCEEPIRCPTCGHALFAMTDGPDGKVFGYSCPECLKRYAERDDQLRQGGIDL